MTALALAAITCDLCPAAAVTSRGQATPAKCNSPPIDVTNGW